MPALTRAMTDALSTHEVHLDTHVDDGGATVLTIAGRLDADTAGRIWTDALDALPPSGSAIVQADGLTYCDGAGIALLHDLADTLRIRGGTLHIRGLNEETRAFLDLSRPEEEATPAEVGKTCLSLPEIVGTHSHVMMRDARDAVTFLGEVAASFFAGIVRPARVRWGEVLLRSTTAGAFALPVVALIGFLLGWVLAFSAAKIMHDYGADGHLARLIGPAMVQELGPLMTCVVLAARSGSAFAAEIGTMKINEEVDALSTMGLDPVRFLVLPKVLAVVFMTPLLTAFSMLFGITGGALVSTFVLDQPLVVYTNLLQNVVTVPQIAWGLGKSVLFGFIVAGVGCFRGLQTGDGPGAVGESTTRSVVTSIVFLAIADAILAVVHRIVGI